MCLYHSPSLTLALPLSPRSLPHSHNFSLSMCFSHSVSLSVSLTFSHSLSHQLPLLHFSMIGSFSRKTA